MQELQPISAQASIDGGKVSIGHAWISRQAAIMAIAACLTVALFFHGAQLRADIIVNGSFEAPLISQQSASFITPAGWTWTPGTDSAPGLINAGAAGFMVANAFYIPAESGQQYLGIGQTNSGFLSQVITIPNAGDYTLTWFDNIGLENPHGTTSPYMVSVKNNLTSGVTSGTFNAATSGGTSWNAETLSLHGLSVGQYTLTFTPEAPSQGFSSLIDNVSMAAPGTAVPEPASALLLVSGVVALVTGRRKL